MKVYAFTDTHGNATALAAIQAAAKKEKPDLIICTGDLTTFEHGMKEILARLQMLHIPVLLLHGNHEAEERLREAAKKHDRLIFLHKEKHEQQGWVFLGYGGEGFKEEDAELERLVKEKGWHTLDWSKVVFLSHAPPHKTDLDDLGQGNHVGSKSLTKLIKKHQPKLVLTGHIHEAFNTEEKMGKTIAINPGPKGRLIDLEKL